MSLKVPLRHVIVVLGLLVGARASGAPAAYDPLAVANGQPRTLDLVVADEGREREIPLRVYLPGERSPAPVVLFSHGLGGSREGNAYLGPTGRSAATWPCSSSTRGATRRCGATSRPGSDEARWSGQPGPRTSCFA